MVYRTEIKIKPADLTDLTVTTDLSSWNLEQFTIEDNALIGDISATSETVNVAISSTGFITQTIALSDIPPTIYLIPANEVETLSDGTNNYPIADKTARLMLEDKADISDIPTNYVTTDTAQTITELKTIDSSQITDGYALVVKMSGDGTQTTAGNTFNSYLAFNDINNVKLGEMNIHNDSAKNNLGFAINNPSTGNWGGTLAVAWNKAQAKAYAYCPAPFEDTNNSIQIDTVGARNTKLQSYALDNAVVKTTGDQNVAGVKSFSSSPVFNMQGYTASNGSSNTNQYKKIFSCIRTETNNGIIIPFIFCASNQTITSGTYNGKISFRIGGTPGSASVSYSGIVLNGNPDFISNGNIVFYLMYKNNYPETDQVTFEVWVYVKNTYQGVNVIPLRMGSGSTTLDFSDVTWGNNLQETTALPTGYSTINQIIL